MLNYSIVIVPCHNWRCKWIDIWGESHRPIAEIGFVLNPQGKQHPQGKQWLLPLPHTWHYGVHSSKLSVTQSLFLHFSSHLQWVHHYLSKYVHWRGLAVMSERANHQSRSLSSNLSPHSFFLFSLSTATQDLTSQSLNKTHTTLFQRERERGREKERMRERQREREERD